MLTVMKRTLKNNRNNIIVCAVAWLIYCISFPSMFTFYLLPLFMPQSQPKAIKCLKPLQRCFIFSIQQQPTAGAHTDRCKRYFTYSPIRNNSEICESAKRNYEMWIGSRIKLHNFSNLRDYTRFNCVLHTSRQKKYFHKILQGQDTHTYIHIHAFEAFVGALCLFSCLK